MRNTVGTRPTGVGGGGFEKSLRWGWGAPLGSRNKRGSASGEGEGRYFHIWAMQVCAAG